MERGLSQRKPKRKKTPDSLPARQPPRDRLPHVGAHAVGGVHGRVALRDAGEDEHRLKPAPRRARARHVSVRVVPHGHDAGRHGHAQARGVGGQGGAGEVVGARVGLPTVVTLSASSGRPATRSYTASSAARNAACPRRGVGCALAHRRSGLEKKSGGWVRERRAWRSPPPTKTSIAICKSVDMHAGSAKQKIAAKGLAEVPTPGGGRGGGAPLRAGASGVACGCAAATDAGDTALKP